jgi:hypothetical protein
MAWSLYYYNVGMRSAIKSYYTTKCYILKGDSK